MVPTKSVNELPKLQYLKEAFWDSRAFLVVTTVYTIIDLAKGVFPSSSQWYGINLLPSLDGWQLLTMWSFVLWVAFFLGSYRVARDLHMEIEQMKTPELSIDLFETRKQHGRWRTFLVITNHSSVPVRAEVWCTGYSISRDSTEVVKTTLQVKHFTADSFLLASEEQHFPPVLEFYQSDVFGPIAVKAPFKQQHEAETIQGEEFIIHFSVFGGKKRRDVSILCGLRDTDLWANKMITSS